MSVAEQIKSKRKAKAKRPKVYMIWRKLVDPETGAMVKAMTAFGQADREILKDRNYRTGDVVRAEITKPRNYGFHCLVHQLGTAVKENVEGFEECSDSHQVIKRLQRESGVFCEEQEIDLPGYGRLVVKVAQSIAFDEMEETDFKKFWADICKYIARRYWPGLNSESIEQMVSLMPEHP